MLYPGFGVALLTHRVNLDAFCSNDGIRIVTKIR